MEGTDRPDRPTTGPEPGSIPGEEWPPAGAPGGDRPEGPAPAGPAEPPRIDRLDSAEARELAAEREETRRLVEAGARTPEELRALAERLRAQRAREEDLWRAAVKPALKRARSDAGQARRVLGLGGGLLGVAALVALAVATGNAGLLLVPVLGVLVAAYLLGRRSGPPGPGPDLLPGSGPDDRR